MRYVILVTLASCIAYAGDIQPPERRAHVMVAGATEVILWAGLGGSPSDDNYLSDTWIYDGTGWRDGEAVSPLSYRAAGAYDSGRGVYVSYGGRYASPNSISNELSEYDANGWRTIQQQGQVPPELKGHAACYMPGYGVLITGGADEAGAVNQYGYVWMGQWATWFRLGNTNPDPNEVHHLVYDPVRKRAVQFGGLNNGVISGDTVEFDPVTGTWSSFNPEHSPGPRILGAYCYIPGLGACVFGGRANGASDSPFYNDLWAWNGQDWNDCSDLIFKRPTPRFCCQMAWLPGTGLLLFGGDEYIPGDSGTRHTNDTTLLFREKYQSVITNFLMVR